MDPFPSPLLSSPLLSSPSPSLSPLLHSPPTLPLTFSIDELLDGGLLTGELTEITGPPASGKTQVIVVTVMCVHSL